MKEYFHIYFDGTEINHIYALEMSSFFNEYDVVNILAQGFVRCINNCKRRFWGHDREASEGLINIIHQFVYVYLAFSDEIKAFHELQNNFSNNFKIESPFFDAVKCVFEERGSKLIDILNIHKLTSRSSDVSVNIFVKYDLLYGPKGPATMYYISLRMSNPIQISSYFIMMKHLLPKLSAETFEIYIYYLMGIISTIKEQNIDYTSVSNMPIIIRSGGEFMCYKMMKENNGEIPLALEKYIPFLCDLSEGQNF